MQLAELDENISHCWRCNHCKWVHSPQSDEFAHACPSIQFGNFHSFSGGGKVITAHALAIGDDVYSDTMLESVFACTMCGACDVSCKINNGEMVEPLEILYALRARVAEDGRSLPAHTAMVASLVEHGNPFGAPAADRAHWAEGLGIKNACKERVDVLLHIGCDSSYNEALWPELNAIVALLHKAKVDFGILFEEECASGELAFDIGFQNEARQLAQRLSDAIAKTNAHSIVTCSAGSFSAFRNIWPRLGVRLPGCTVRHITEFVDDLIESGTLTLGGGFSGTVTYHDPCKLGRLGEAYQPAKSSWTRVLNTMMTHAEPKQILFGNDGLYEAPRRLLRRIPGLNLVEMERNRVASYCCGAKGGAAEAFPDFAQSAARHRLDEALSTGAAIVATASGGCRCHLESVARADQEPLKIMGIFELLASASV